MGRIKILSDEVVRRIAAGEVIECPSSVVKELLENSLDAGAHKIDITVEEGGKRKVVVSDDGCGMDADDLRLALVSHATSKISDEADIYRIETLGFRGEALSSIRSVASVEIKSRMKDSEHGWLIRAEAERIGEVLPCAMNCGTTVTVENLFFNLPARKKFLRSEQFETSRIIETVTKLALCHYDVAFRLTQKSQTLLNCPAVDGYLSRINGLFGGETKDSLLEGQAEESDVCALVFVAPPYLSRTDARIIYTFVNNRCVKEETARKALKDAFKEHLPSQRYPVAFIYITLPPETIDVNIHPTKEAVQIKKPALVYTAVRRAIDSALSGVRRFYAGGISSGLAERHRQIEQALSDYLKRNADVPTQKPLAVHFHSLKKQNEFVEETIPDGRFFVLHNAYIALETSEGFILIDQHALHERLIYDRLRALLAEQGLRLQRLLVPITVRLDAVEVTVFQYNKALFKTLGIDAELNGTNLTILSIPDLGVVQGEWENIVHQMMSEIIEQPDRDYKTRLDNALKTLACKAAVKAGEPLDSREVYTLLSEARRCHIPATCPHGRPLIKRFPLSEVERWFKR